MDATIIEEFIKNLSIGFPIACTIINTKALSKAKLQRKSFNGKIINSPIVFFNIFSNFSKEEIDYIKIEILRPYVEKLYEYIPIEDMKLVRRNIKNVSVKKKKCMLFMGISGSYNDYDNEITYSEQSAIGHEFLHMASSFYDAVNDIYYLGFMYNDDKNTIGESLNEGYTELLNIKIFGIYEKEKAYCEEVRIVKMLELFFEDEKEMQHLYFSCNLLGFIKKLEKYASYDEIVKLIIDMDDYSIYKQNGILLATSKRISIYQRIYKWFISKNNDQEKIKKLEELIDEDKMASIIINKQKMKLYKYSPYDKKINSLDNINNYKKR